MGILYEDQYREQLSERFSEILRIDSVFHGMKTKAEQDYNAGRIDKDVYQEVMNATYFTPLSSRCKNYAIPERNRLLVLKYGKFLNSGELSLTDLESSYLEIVGRLDNVANSVKGYYSFYNLSLEELREKVLDFVRTLTLEKIAELKGKIKVLEDKEKALKPEERAQSILGIGIKQYKKDIVKIENDEKNIINSVLAADHDTLMHYVCTKTSINERFYKWYRVRKNKEKVKNGEYKTVEISGLNGSRVNAVACRESIKTSEDLIKHIVEVNGWITDFATRSATVTNDIGKRHGMSRLYSKEECFRLFKKFYDIDTFLNYLPSYLDNDNSLSDVDIFKIFYLENFLDYKKVDPDKFRMVLIKSVLEYYNSLILKYSSVLRNMIGKASARIDEVVEDNVKVTSNVVIMRDAIGDLTDETDYLNGYLTKEEEEELYDSLNKYFEEMDKMVKGEAKRLDNGKKSSN